MPRYRLASGSIVSCEADLARRVGAVALDGDEAAPPAGDTGADADTSDETAAAAPDVADGDAPGDDAGDPAGAQHEADTAGSEDLDEDGLEELDVVILRERAEDLGIRVDGRWSAETIAQKIAEAEQADADNPEE